MDSIGSRIQDIRKKQGLNQSAFAGELGVSRAHISNIENENDKPSEILLRYIALKFAINLDWLRTGNGDSSLDMGASKEQTINTYRHFVLLLENQFAKYGTDELWPTVEAFQSFVLTVTDPYLMQEDKKHKVVTQESLERTKEMLEHINTIQQLLRGIVGYSSETARKMTGKADYEAILKAKDHSQKLLGELNQEVLKMVDSMLQPGIE